MDIQFNGGKNFLYTFILNLLVCILMSCSGNTYTYPKTLASTGKNELVLSKGTFKTKLKEYEADYGTIKVSENRSKKDSRLIELPVIRIYSSSAKAKEAIFILQGGPGKSNMTFIPPDYLLSDYDIVMVGYRGADGSSILECPEVEEALKADGDVLSEDFLRNLGTAWEKAGNRFKKEGIDLNSYTIMEVIDDMESVRIALNYKRVNLTSWSYGTRIAYIYALKYPKSIHRSVMISVATPGRFVWEAKKIDEQLAYYGDLWAKDSTMVASSPNLLETIRSVNKNMPKSWLFLKINPSKVRLATFIMLNSRDNAAKVFDAYVAAENGDPSGLAFMSNAYDFVVPSSKIWGDFAAKSFSADYDSTRNYFKELDPPNSILGSPLGKLAWASLQFGKWPIKKIPKKYRKMQHSDVETLIISGSIDFSTPAEFATNDMLPYLSRGKQVIIAEAAHVGDIFSLHKKNAELLLTSFYKTGIANDSLNTYLPMNFNVNGGWQKTIKTGLFITASVLATIVYFLVR